jgi:ABC-type spermidine/putrescine transport system permease subunit II
MATSLISSAFLTATVVLGEFTIASTLAKNTFATFSFEYFSRDPQGGVGLALLTLVATTALLGVMTVLTRSKSRKATTVTRF